MAVVVTMMAANARVRSRFRDIQNPRFKGASLLRATGKMEEILLFPSKKIVSQELETNRTRIPNH